MRNGCSDRLSRLEDASDLTFQEIMDLYEAQIDEECVEFLDDPEVDENGTLLSQVNEMRAAKQEALIIYNKFSGLHPEDIETVEELASEEMQQSEIPALVAIGNALEAHYYSPLAI